MPTVRFTQNIQRHVACPTLQVAGETIRGALESYFQLHERARGYVLDDQGNLRTHMAAFVDGRQLDDRGNLDQPIDSGAVLDVVQALSGG